MERNLKSPALPIQRRALFFNFSSLSLKRPYLQSLRLSWFLTAGLKNHIEMIGIFWAEGINPCGGLHHPPKPPFYVLDFPTSVRLRSSLKSPLSPGGRGSGWGGIFLLPQAGRDSRAAVLPWKVMRGKVSFDNWRYALITNTDAVTLLLDHFMNIEYNFMKKQRGPLWPICKLRESMKIFTPKSKS